MKIWAASVPDRQVPMAQKSPAVHALPSSHAFALFLKTQPMAGLQLSVVQTLLSSQVTGAPTHDPFEHVSPVVHAFRSLHEFVLFV
jgi:MFS superfamily sulfate permease-like transporter